MAIFISSLPINGVIYHRDQLDRLELVATSVRRLVVLAIGGGGTKTTHSQARAWLGLDGFSSAWIAATLPLVSILEDDGDQSSWAAGDSGTG